MRESEEILLQRFVNTGDAEAFSEIVHRYAGLVYGSCLRVLEDQAAAADATQETFYQLLRNAGRITGSVPAWLHKVATCKAINAIRSDSSRRRREARYMADKPREAMKWEDVSLYVDEELSELDEQTKDILIQHFFEGRTTTDIAAGQGLSQSTVSRRIDSGVEKLRGKLRKRGIMVALATLTGLLSENAVQAAPVVILKELGKMALVGGPAVAASGTTTAVAATSATATKAAAGGVLSTLTGKIVTAAAVTAVGVGSVVTYNEVSSPPEQPVTEVVSAPVEQQQPRRTTRTTESPPAERASQTVIVPQDIAEEVETPAPQEIVADDYTEPEEISSSEVVEPEAPAGEQVSSGTTRAVGGYYAARFSAPKKAEDPNSLDDNSQKPRMRVWGGSGRRRRSRQATETEMLNAEEF